jgi:hypothetical protein
MNEEKEDISEKDLAFELAKKVRTELDKVSCPGFFMEVAFESIIKHYSRLNKKWGIREIM